MVTIGSDLPEYFEIAGLSHPAIIKSMGEFLTQVDIEDMKKGYLGFNNRDPKRIPIWGQHYASTVMDLLMKIHLPKMHSTIIPSEYDGTKYQGIIATSSNHATEMILSNYGFERKEQVSKYGITKWLFVLNFEKSETP